ncbi:MAG: tetratricopeptide repeat protein [Fimbriimonas sp.]
MLRRIAPLILAGLAIGAPAAASAQFVYPKPEYNRPEPGLYHEDPFIVEYRRKFFGVFRGDVATFEKAYAEIEAMLRKNPKDARALVWLGNGQTVKGGVLLMKGQRDASLALLAKSRMTLDRAVALRPNDPNIYMMRAATLYIQGQYWAPKDIPRETWERLRDDCLRFDKYIGPAKWPRASIHLRGETFGELGIAYKRLGEKEKAREAFERVIALCPGTDYETRARKEIERL